MLVADLMDSQPRCLAPDKTVEDAQRLMDKYHVRHVPIAESERSSAGVPKMTLLGIVSSRDIMRAIPGKGAVAYTPAEEARALSTHLTGVMTNSPLVTTPNEPVEEAVDRMLTKKIDSLPVVLDEKSQSLVGLFTSDSLLRHLANPEVGAKLGVAEEIMRKGLVTVEPSSPIKLAMQRMQEMRVRHMPVVSISAGLVGMLSDHDILRVLPAMAKSTVGRRIAQDKGTTGIFRGLLFAYDDDDGSALAVLNQQVQQVMTKQLITSSPGAPISTLAQVMLDKMISSVPIIEPKTVFMTGILTRTDLMRYAASLWRKPSQPA
jgi:CBS domain-containing protein